MPKGIRFVVTAAAAALALAGTAQAQDKPRMPPGFPQPKPKTQPQQTPPQTTPSDPGSQPSGQPGAHGSVSPEMQKWLSELSTRNEGILSAAKLADERASSTEVKQLAKKLEQDRSAMRQPLETYAKDRAAQVSRSSDVQQAWSGLLDRLRAQKGEEFDRTFVSEMLQQTHYDVELTKKMRDQTPGKDASFKKWLDDIENTMEGDLTAARQVKQSLDGQRAARRTPGSSGR